MPNTAVKPLYAESTRLETVREDRELPVKKIPHLMDAEFFLCQRRMDTQMRGHLLLNLRPFGRPGRACLRHAPTTLVSGYRASGPRNGSIDNPVPVVSVEINDPNDVGARRRQARPGL